MSKPQTITSAEMRALEQDVMGSGSVTGLELMERAGMGVVVAIFEEWPEFSLGQPRAVVLCGPGNNGGDGFVVARLLKGRGWSVEVFFYGDVHRLSSDAQSNYERWSGIGEIRTMTDETFDGWPEPEVDVDLVIDAIFGIGLTRPFVAFGHLRDQLNYIQAHYFARSSLSGGVVAIDVPSGMNADTGQYPGFEHESPFDQCIVANLTVTFHARKPGHVFVDGPGYCGKVVVKDIGL